MGYLGSGELLFNLNPGKRTSRDYFANAVFQTNDIYLSRLRKTQHILSYVKHIVYYMEIERHFHFQNNMFIYDWILLDMYSK